MTKEEQLCFDLDIKINDVHQVVSKAAEQLGFNFILFTDDRVSIHVDDDSPLQAIVNALHKTLDRTKDGGKSSREKHTL